MIGSEYTLSTVTCDCWSDANSSEVNCMPTIPVFADCHISLIHCLPLHNRQERLTLSELSGVTESSSGLMRSLSAIVSVGIVISLETLVSSVLHEGIGTTDVCFDGRLKYLATIHVISILSAFPNICL